MADYLVYLIQQVFVSHQDPNPPPSEHGPYRIVGDAQQSQIFDPDLQANFVPVLKQLQFASGRNITLHDREIGRAIQTARRLSTSDTTLLKKHALTLTPVQN